MDKDAWRNRLKERMDELHMTSADLARNAKVGPTMVHDILKRGVTPSVVNLAKLASALGLRLVDLLEDSDRIPRTIKPCGVLGGGDMWLQADAADVPLDVFFSDLVSILVQTNDLAPAYKTGDVLAGPRSVGAHLDNHIGLDCIIETIDGARYLRTLHRGTRAGRYALRSLDRSKSDIIDAALAWAAPIRMIIR